MPDGERLFREHLSAIPCDVIVEPAMRMRWSKTQL